MMTQEVHRGGIGWQSDLGLPDEANTCFVDVVP